MPRGYRNDFEKEKAIAYIHGRIEAQLEHYAGAIGATPQELAARVGQLLTGQHQEQEQLASEVPGVSRSAASVDQQLRKVAVDRGTYGGEAQRRGESRLKGKRQEWWWRLSKADRERIIAQRKASAVKTFAARRRARG